MSQSDSENAPDIVAKTDDVVETLVPISNVIEITAPQRISLKRSNIFIGISGLIGAGKSTLAAALAKELDLPVFYEPVADNVYLADFYKDMKSHSFALQVYLLNRRFEQHQQIIWNNNGGVQDRTIYEDSVFARVLLRQGNMDQRDYETYRSLFKNMSNFMRHPNFIVHLDVTPEESMERIKIRSRGCESGISLDYLKCLYEEYNIFLAQVSKRIPVIRVRWEKFRTVEEMAKVIAEAFMRMNNITDVSFNSSVMSSPKPVLIGQDITAHNEDVKRKIMQDSVYF